MNCTTCGRPRDNHPFRHPFTTAPAPDPGGKKKIDLQALWESAQKQTEAWMQEHALDLCDWLQSLLHESQAQLAARDVEVRRLREVGDGLLAAMEHWGQMEDGIPEECVAYDEAVRALAPPMMQCECVGWARHCVLKESNGGHHEDCIWAKRLETLGQGGGGE